MAITANRFKAKATAPITLPDLYRMIKEDDVDILKQAISENVDIFDFNKQGNFFKKACLSGKKVFSHYLKHINETESLTLGECVQRSKALSGSEIPPVHVFKALVQNGIQYGDIAINPIHSYIASVICTLLTHGVFGEQKDNKKLNCHTTDAIAFIVSIKPSSTKHTTEWISLIYDNFNMLTTKGSSNEQEDLLTEIALRILGKIYTSADKSTHIKLLSDERLKDSAALRSAATLFFNKKVKKASLLDETLSIVINHYPTFLKKVIARNFAVKILKRELKDLPDTVFKLLSTELIDVGELPLNEVHSDFTRILKQTPSAATFFKAYVIRELQRQKGCESMSIAEFVQSRPNQRGAIIKATLAVALVELSENETIALCSTISQADALVTLGVMPYTIMVNTKYDAVRTHCLTLTANT